MAHYDAWNRAIAAYFTAGAAKGSPIFLSVDLEAIEEVANRFLDEPVAGDPLLDFVGAVRQRCIVSSRESVSIEGLRAKIGDVPGGVGFLGLLVFAAYHMQEEEGIDESNYFLRLREVLELPPHRGRPEGMPAGAEESLWKAWNKYLTDAGFLATAEHGAASQIYLRYVLSQAILRESDKQYLRKRFHDDHLPLLFDCDQLGFWLSRQLVNRKHLSEGLHHSDPGRVWEFYRAAYRVYEVGDWVSGATAHSATDRTRLRSIECGLYRTEDLVGESQYWLFPKQPARMRSSQLAVTPPHGASDQPLRPLRAGFFAPLWPRTPFADDALEYNVVGDPGVQKLLFPKREFWILMPDPENPQGAWATWRPYLELGERLLVLCREGPFDAEMARFKEDKLMDWTARVECEGWVEYHGCMVLSYDWGGFIATPECRALADALAPRAMAGVSLMGGLRDPNQNAWLEGFPPAMKVYGFEHQFELVVTSAHGFEVYQEEIPRQHEVTLPHDLEPDTYQIEVKFGGKRVAVRMLRVVPWANIQEHPEPEEITNYNPASTAGLSLRGALIVQNAGDSTEVAHA
jgi:hypothetical protein